MLVDFFMVFFYWNSSLYLIILFTVEYSATCRPLDPCTINSGLIISFAFFLFFIQYENRGGYDNEWRFWNLNYKLMRSKIGIIRKEKNISEDCNGNASMHKSVYKRTRVLASRDSRIGGNLDWNWVKNMEKASISWKYRKVFLGILLLENYHLKVCFQCKVCRFIATSKSLYLHNFGLCSKAKKIENNFYVSPFHKEISYVSRREKERK